jgi:hypothetical protein
MNQRKTHYLSSLRIGLALGFLALIDARLSAYAQNQPVNTVLSDMEPSTISAREQELQRKEAELLKALHGSVAQQDQSGASVPSPGSESDSRPLITINNAPSIPYGSEQLDGEHNALRVLEHHPALSPLPPRTAPPAPATNTFSSGIIKTHESENHPDGTTARRIGTYKRVSGSYDRSQGYTRQTSRTHTISLGRVENEIWVNPESLSNQEVATIRSSSAMLRTGPSRQGTNLTRIPQYSEVAVDYRRGDWYRVKTDRGVRGWVPGTTLLFDAGTSPVSTVRIGAVTGKIR